MTARHQPDSPCNGPHRPPRPERGWAYFLDFDGTLVDIAPTPEAVRVEPALIATLGGILAATAGAVTVVSGRTMAELDAFLAPLVLPVAARHGGERRFADGRIERPAADPALAAAAGRIRMFCEHHPGTLMEEKDTSLTLHYRGAPEVSDAAVRLMTGLAEDAGPRYRLLRGKMVLELKPADVDKGRAIAAFMTQAPFAGRRPVMLGDDRTDEDGFRTVNAMQGVSVRVGDSLAGSEAVYRLRSPSAVRDWLGLLLDAASD